MTHIFISYSRHNIDFARYTRAMLENAGFPVWMDEKRLSPGTNWWDEIETAIDTCSAFIIIMSPESRESVFCRNEILRALDRKKSLFPILYRGQHFGMIAHVQHEDMRGGLNDSLSKGFINRLRTITGHTTSRTVRFDVLHSPVEAVEADVLIQKHTPATGGVYSMLMKRFNQHDVHVESDVMQNIGDYLIVDTQGAINTNYVAFVKTEWIGRFGYRQVRTFSERGLSVIGQELPDAQHLIMSIHGVNTQLRLDEGESLLAQLAGLIDVLQDWQAPHALNRITIVEFDADRVRRIKTILDTYFDEVHYAQPATDGDWGYDLTFTRQNQIVKPDAGSADVKPYALAIFPDDADLEDIFYYGIERPVHARGLLCERLNPYDLDQTDNLATVLERIKLATTVICDITELTPELYLQLGYAWGAEIPTVLISRNDEKPPLPGEVIHYQKIWQLEERLSSWINMTL